jgi:hypothetical protein
MRSVMIMSAKYVSASTAPVPSASKHGTEEAGRPHMQTTHGGYSRQREIFFWLSDFPGAAHFQASSRR